MTANELKALLPTGTYPDLVSLDQDIRRALRGAFPDCEKIERDSETFSIRKEPGRPLDAVMLFRPQDTGVNYWIRIVSGRVEQVAEGGSGPTNWIA